MPPLTALSALRPRRTTALPAAAGALALVGTAALAHRWPPAGLAPDDSVLLAVWLGCVAGWLMGRWHEAGVAAAALALLMVSGALTPQHLRDAVSHDLTLLLAASMVQAHAARACGLDQRLAAGLQSASHFTALCWRVSGLALLSAFVVPGTTARAALWRPVLGALGERLGHPRQVAALAVLMPTVVLLSACAWLGGAAAHVLAVDYLAASRAPVPGVLGWSLIGLPFAALTGAAATVLVLNLCVSPAERRAALRPPPAPAQAPWSLRQQAGVLVMLATVFAWLVSDWHGLSVGTVAAVGAALSCLTLPGPGGARTRQVLQALDGPCLVFVVSTMALAQAFLDSAASGWATHRLTSALGGLSGAGQGLALTAAIVVSLLAHLVVPSRTARLAVLLPCVVVPLTAGGLPPLVAVMVVCLASGYCQLSPHGAKALALFRAGSQPGYTPQDLRRVSLALLPVMAVACGALALVLTLVSGAWPAAGTPPTP